MLDAVEGLVTLLGSFISMEMAYYAEPLVADGRKHLAALNGLPPEEVN